MDICFSIFDYLIFDSSSKSITILRVKALKQSRSTATPNTNKCTQRIDTALHFVVMR